ncbi:hypothetical protein FBALC1_10437 [Flavobacteriales bacterium ALC-1]|nr:hypothetical protein FBALC1_10437 [Flavobacteriales bacterium ALC-1]
MKIKTLKLSLYLLALVAVFVSCEQDDDPTNTFTEEDRDVQQLKDKDSLLDYLNTHYYNSSFFESGTNHKYTDIVITELEEGEDVPSGSTLLIDDIEIHTTVFLDYDYEYYILRINQGEGGSPKFTDAVRMRYEGSSVVDGDIFDSRATPIDLSLVGNSISTFGTIRGWQLVIPSFNSAMDFNIDGNGNVNYNGFGLGVMFLPSGLAYYSGITTGSPYDNLIFKFELLQYDEADHDLDELPSHIEDLDGDLDVNNDDTDDDGFPNYIDFDDDGDGVSTTDELMPKQYIVDTNMGEGEPTLETNEYETSRSENNGIITINTVTIADSNSDGLADYLDEDITINYNEEN